ncbi:MAG: putative lipid II flippase FtsW [Oscillospiraceae bacterium]|nr:putative lipid II flippase FtsW [Oscillospiraceae bacterium]
MEPYYAEKRAETREPVISRTSRKTDAPLLLATLLLVAFGLIMMYSASYASAYYMFGDGMRYIRSQALYAVIGVAAMMLISRINYRILHPFTWLIITVSYVLLVITLFMPQINDARRWIIIGTFTFQPSELVKFAVILLISHLAAVRPDKMRNFKYGFIQPMTVLAFIILIMGLQPHLSGAIIITALLLLLMVIGGARWQWFVMLGGVGAPLAVLVVLATNRLGYVLSRVNVWLNPLENISEGYQTFQSLLAIGSGGLMGLGLGNSRQKHLYVPEPHNDFVFAIICEELGFIGAVFVIALFIFFVFRGFSVALKAKDRFGAMLAIGITLQIGIQALLNIAVVSNTMPNTGISLPFFSQGGTSLVILLAEVGVLLSVARFSESGTDVKRKG